MQNLNIYFFCHNKYPMNHRPVKLYPRKNWNIQVQREIDSHRGESVYLPTLCFVLLSRPNIPNLISCKHVDRLKFSEMKEDEVKGQWEKENTIRYKETLLKHARPIQEINTLRTSRASTTMKVHQRPLTVINKHSLMQMRKVNVLRVSYLS